MVKRIHCDGCKKVETRTETFMEVWIIHENSWSPNSFAPERKTAYHLCKHCFEPVAWILNGRFR